MNATKNEVRLEWLRPRAIEAAQAACPTLLQPLGTIEWHGLHNVVGLDAVKAHLLCIAAAQRGGGLVAPPLFGGMGGLDQPYTFVIEPEDTFQTVLVRGWLERLCWEAVRQGFRAMIFLTGHYGAVQQVVVRETAVRMTRLLGVPILGIPEYFLALDAGYIGDHAGWGETSLMLHLAPDSVDQSQLGEPPHKGVGGRDPREATAADGKRIAEVIITRLADLARQMPTWDADTCRRFADAEAALLSRQLTLAASEKLIWAGWRNIGAGALHPYGALLVERKFDEITALAEKL
ncbi:MAG: creatininase family protein [bacterium]|nr:creatininase family protein [bacterium]